MFLSANASQSTCYALKKDETSVTTTLKINQCCLLQTEEMVQDPVSRVVCITNEHNSWETCTCCFEKTTHPVNMVDGKLKTMNGASVCCNQECLLLRSKKTPSNKSLSICLTHQFIWLVRSVLRYKNISQSNTDFQEFVGAFLAQSLPRPAA